MIGGFSQELRQPGFEPGTRVASMAKMHSANNPRRTTGKAGVVPFLSCRGHCASLWTVLPPLQVVLSSACSVASLSRCPSHYLPGHPHLRVDALADYPFGRGNPSTWRTGRTALHDIPSAKLPFGAQRSMTLSRYQLQRQLKTQPAKTLAYENQMEATQQNDACCTRPVAN